MKTKLLLSIGATLLISIPANAGYVHNDPINNVDPTGECSTDADGNSVGVCPTDLQSTVVLEVTKMVSPETAQANALAESQGVNVPFTYKPSQVGSVTNGQMDPNTRIVTDLSVSVGGQSPPVAAVNTETGKTIAYQLSPIESTAHEVGGHVGEYLSGPRPSGFADPHTPMHEVGPMGVGNRLRQSLGVPVERQTYSGYPPVSVGPNGPRPPKTINDFLNRD